MALVDTETEYPEELPSDMSDSDKLDMIWAYLVSLDNRIATIEDAHKTIVGAVLEFKDSPMVKMFAMRNGL